MATKASSSASFRTAALLACVLLLNGCASMHPAGGSRQAAADWAGQRGFTPAAFKSDGLELTAFIRRPQTAARTMTVYIEGDGASWRTPFHPPRDPTPTTPTALVMAAADPETAVVYLGRPCQYLELEELARCPGEYWLEKRFAPEVIAAYDQAINQLKSAEKVDAIRLVGYSGGGVVATLLAARRRDVEGLITVAAPLALSEWTRRHGATPLDGSLDPLVAVGPLPAGVHFAGENDKTVPPEVLGKFVEAKGGRLRVIPGFTHHCCWSQEWAPLLRSVHQEYPK